MSYAPVVTRTLANGLDALSNVEDDWNSNAWADDDDDNDNELHVPEQASHSDHTRNQNESTGSTNGIPEHTSYHTRASTASVLDSPGRSGLRSRKGSAHRRAATVGDSTASSRSGSIVTQVRTHPLQVAKAPTERDGFATRPSLKRWLSNGADSTSQSDDGLPDVQDGTSTRVKEAEAMVIVHEVTKTDSLAGIALRYGIALADLRRVNHLWASDPIHLRKVLYIPIHLTSKKLAIAESHLNGQLISKDESSSSTAASIGQSSTTVVQRVPVSQLSFFPPPSKPFPTSTPASPPPPFFTTNSNNSNPYATSSRISRARSATTNNGPGPSLSSFLQTIQQQFNIPSLPLSVGLNRPRISLDSTDISSSTPASEASSDQEHEMDVLSRRFRPGSSRPHEGDRDRGRKASSSQSYSNHHKRRLEAEADLRTYPGLARKSSQSTLTLPPPQLQPRPVEVVPFAPVTEQLKPSPRMELPRSSM